MKLEEVSDDVISGLHVQLIAGNDIILAGAFGVNVNACQHACKDVEISHSERS